MIKLVGLKRIAILCALLGINILAAGFYFMILSPMLDEAHAQLSAVNSDISQLNGKITGAKQDIVFVNDNLDKYQAISDKGLFREQDRFMVDRLLQEMRGRSEISSFSFNIGDMTDIPSPDAAAINYSLVGSKVTVDQIGSMLDTGIFTFVQDIDKTFPGHTRIRRLHVKRTAALNEQALRDVTDGKPVNFMTADIAFDWITLVAKTDGATNGSGAH